MLKYLWILGLVLSLNLYQARAEGIAGEGMFAATCVHGPDSFNCVDFVKNHDGDTFTVEIRNVPPLIGHGITVRVLGVDAPEMDSSDSCERSAALRAKSEVEGFLKSASRIDLKRLGRDKYFRILADVKVDGQSLSEFLLKNRLAVAYDGGTKRHVDWCRF